jgi:hypothetical protein
VPAADLAAADALAVARAWLDAHEGVRRALDPVNVAGGRVGPYNEPPYPRLRLSEAPGDDRDLRWLLAPVLTIEALGDLDGTITPTVLRQIMYAALGALTELPEAEVPPGQPVVTSVRSLSGAVNSPLPTGQERYVTTVQFSIHPPTPTA